MDAEPRRGRALTSGPVAHRGRSLVLAGLAYLLLAVVLWWHVWTNHPTSTTTCGCGDSSLFTWFIEWPAYAIAHGHSPFSSTAAGFPGGVNLLANTSVLAVGVLLAPVTWLFGPVATMNVALTLAPALSALAMFVLVRRWVSWAPAAFFAGLLYGFSPFVLVSLDDAHLMLGIAFVPPLVVACLDELLVRQRASPVLTGVLLGLLVTLQFFLSTEILMIMAVMAAVGIVVLVVSAAVFRRDALRRATPASVVGLGAGLVTTAVLLAYPAWFALAGPAHLSGLVWPNFHAAYGGNTVGAFVRPAPALSSGFFGSVMSRVVGGSQGPVLSPQYLGVGVLAVVAVGTAVWRRDRKLWFFGALAVISAVLSLGEKHHTFLPWQLAANLPLLENISASRFVLVTYLCIAVSTGLIVDHSRRAVLARAGSPRRDHAEHRTARHAAGQTRTRGRPPAGSRWAAGLVATAVAALALVPLGRYLSRGLPYTTEPVVLPTWFDRVGPHLDPKQVLLVLPAPFADTQVAMTWQAVDKMAFSMAGQGGPAGAIGRAGAERAGQTALTDATFFFSPNTAITATGAKAAKAAMHAWGVTEVVMPDQPSLPAYDRIRSPTDAAALLTAATGILPVRQADAWVWLGVERTRPWTTPSTATIDRCLAGLAYDGAHAIETATGCVAAAGNRGATG